MSPSFPSSFQNQTVVGVHASALATILATVKTKARAHGLFGARDSRAEGEAPLAVAGEGEHACAGHEDRDDRLEDRARAARLGRDPN